MFRLGETYVDSFYVERERERERKKESLSANIMASDLELRSFYCLHFQTNAQKKSMNFVTTPKQ